MNIKRFLRKSKFKIEFALSSRLRWMLYKYPEELFFIEHKTPMILNGPFKGLKYIVSSTGSTLIPKLLGTYEQELHPVLSQIITNGYENINIIGAGEGYYVVGLSSLIKNTTINAFETDLNGRKNIKELISINQIKSKVNVMGTADLDSLNEYIKNKTCIICDIEGGEKELLNIDKIQSLKICDILVEIHDLPGTKDTEKLILTRFNDTHEIETISFKERQSNDSIPWISFTKNKILLYAMVDEKRTYGLKWFWMKSLANKNSPLL